jgi:hypothetical protein
MFDAIAVGMAAVAVSMAKSGAEADHNTSVHL